MKKISVELFECVLIPLVIFFMFVAMIREIPKLEKDPIKKKYWFMYRLTTGLYIFGFVPILYISYCKLLEITGDNKFGIYYCMAVAFVVLVFLLSAIFSHSAKLARCLQHESLITKVLFPGYEEVIHGLFLTKYYWAVWVTLLLSISLYLLGREM